MRFKLIAITLIIILLGIILVGCEREKKLQEELDRTESVMYAYAQEYTDECERSEQYQLTIHQLSMSRDTIMQKLDEARKMLNIKDKNVRRIEYIASVITNTDTIYIEDKCADIDTTLSNEWYSVRMTKNDTILSVTPTFRNETYVVVSAKRETINTPRRFPLFRLFQKKRDVVVVDVMELSPFATLKNKRFVEIAQ